jgi:hypothetical protein
MPVIECARMLAVDADWCGRAPDQGAAHDYGELRGVPTIYSRARIR